METWQTIGSAPRERLHELVRNGEGLHFTARDVQRLSGPLVYVVFEHDEPIYVGMSGNGASRPFNPGHPVTSAISEHGSVMLWPLETVQDAVAMEALLISRLQPRMNKRLMTSEARRLLGYRGHGAVAAYRRAQSAPPQPMPPSSSGTRVATESDATRVGQEG